MGVFRLRPNEQETKEVKVAFAPTVESLLELSAAAGTILSQETLAARLAINIAELERYMKANDAPAAVVERLRNEMAAFPQGHIVYQATISFTEFLDTEDQEQPGDDKGDRG